MAGPTAGDAPEVLPDEMRCDLAQECHQPVVEYPAALQRVSRVPHAQRAIVIAVRRICGTVDEDARMPRRGGRKIDAHLSTLAPRRGDGPAVSHSTVSGPTRHMQPDDVSPRVAFESQTVCESAVPRSLATPWVHDGRRKNESA